MPPISPKSAKKIKLRRQFFANALAAREQMIASGMGFDAEEVHAYLRARIAGRETSRPQAKSWRT